MKGKSLLILLAVAGLLVTAAWLLNMDKASDKDAKMGTRLLADLPVNQVAIVTVADSQSSTTLVRGDAVWQVAERNGYRADFETLRDTVVKLSRMKIGRSFSADAQSLERLSLLPPTDASETGRGQRITLKDADGKALADLILGKVRSLEGGGGGGQYVRQMDGNTVFLVDGDFQFLKIAAAEWLQKSLLDIKAETVESVTCYAGNKKRVRYTLKRPAKGQPARLDAVPGGQVADRARIDQVLDALNPLSLDDVAPADGPAEAVGTDPWLLYRLYDGREIAIYPFSDGKEHYTLRVAAGGALVQTDAEPKEKAPAEAEEKPGTEEKAEAEEPAVRSVEQLNQELGPWTFSVKKWQYDSFVTRAEELVKKEG